MSSRRTLTWDRRRWIAVIRIAVGLSLVVILACIGLSIALLRTEDSMAGVGVVALGFFSTLAIGLIWLLAGGSKLLRFIRSQTKSLREGPPESDAKPPTPPR